jgi:hypothetical protein
LAPEPVKINNDESYASFIKPATELLREFNV